MEHMFDAAYLDFRKRYINVMLTASDLTQMLRPIQAIVNLLSVKTADACCEQHGTELLSDTPANELLNQVYENLCNAYDALYKAEITLRKASASNE